MAVFCYFAEMLQTDVRVEKMEQPRNWRTLDGKESTIERELRRELMSRRKAIWKMYLGYSGYRLVAQSSHHKIHKQTHTHTHAHAYACINAHHN